MTKIEVNKMFKVKTNYSLKPYGNNNKAHNKTNIQAKPQGR